MGQFKIIAQRKSVHDNGITIWNYYSNRDFRKFNPSVLGIGKIDSPSDEIDAIVETKEGKQKQPKAHTRRNTPLETCRQSART